MTMEHGGVDSEMLSALRRADLLAPDETPTCEALAGGVSSDIWKVTGERGVFCVKRALARLKVAADWQAPVARNRYEVAWYEVVHDIVPEAVPCVLMHDVRASMFAMSHLDPADHLLWKSELRDGRADRGQAAEVGRRLACIHAATANDAVVAARFPRADIFRAIRLEPYLEATAARHADLHAILFALSERTAATRIAMIHGDVSPKNIVLGPRGPVFLDAECACIGDPAFDLAFCLNHLLLKCLWNRAASDALLACFAALSDAYISGVCWEARAGLEQRAASLLPALLLARVDGKSPVEYLRTADELEHVRRVGRGLLTASVTSLAAVADAWREEIAT